MTVRCRICGRPLHTPTTAARGIGPHCARKTRHATTSRHRENPSPDHCPGQQPLFDPTTGTTDPAA
ncbi:DUF6011 domain-containing protein [Streptomyces sp. NPDC006798]|uniref:DUF6011 domain-containing protein n=1 Tax=Streptomyces sp. NPDC006798 TaxID=3155462 RepID=UPI0033F4D529